MIFKEIQNNIDNNLPFTVFRKPNQQEIFYIRENKGEKTFVFSSFDQESQYKISYDKSIVINLDDKYSQVLNLPHINLSNDNLSSKEYIDCVTKVKQYIDTSNVDKIVFSHSILIEKQIDLFNTFKSLMSKYANAFCYIWFHPETGIWIGATPEVLTRIEGTHLQTMSLAGTKTADDMWTEKEYLEQKVVSEYIKNRLQPLSKKVNVDDVQTIQSGNIQHLLTKISSELLTDNYKEIISTIHPTPAVCGMPTNAARDYILKNENYDRLYYTGFLGQLSQDKVELYVNLRCAQVNRSQVKLYVGGGINSMSIPEKEWIETQLKSKVIIENLVS